MLLGSRSARADAEPDWSRGVLVYVDGVGSDRARGELIRSVPGSIPIVRSAQIKKTHGERLGTILTKPARRKTWLRDVGRTIYEAGAEGAVIVYLGPTGRKGHEESLLILQGSKPQILLEQKLTLQAESPDVRVARWRGVIEDITGEKAETAEAPPAAAAQQKPPRGEAETTPNSRLEGENPYARESQAGASSAPEAQATAEPSRKRKKRRKKRRAKVHEAAAPAPPHWLAVRSGFEWGARFFKHSEPTTHSERSYTARGINTLTLGARLFPFMASEERIWQSFSIDGEYATSIGLNSKLSSPGQGEDPDIATRFYRYALGLRGRIPLSSERDDMWGLGFGVGYADWTFHFDAPGATGRVAAEEYHLIRPSLGVDVQNAPITFAVTLSYMHLLSVDKLGQRTPQGWQGGLDAELSGTLRLASFFELGLYAGYARFFYSLKPITARQAEDEPGSVTDDYLRLGLFAQFVF